MAKLCGDCAYLDRSIKGVFVLRKEVAFWCHYQNHYVGPSWYACSAFYRLFGYTDLVLKTWAIL